MKIIALETLLATVSWIWCFLGGIYCIKRNYGPFSKIGLIFTLPSIVMVIIMVIMEIYLIIKNLKQF